MSTASATVPPPADKFQSRDELVSFIEEQATTAVERATRVERRVPWATAGPVCQDSAGYSVLKAAAFALGYVGPEQAKEEIHAHQQLRDLYAGYGFVPHHGQQSFLVPLATGIERMIGSGMVSGATATEDTSKLLYARAFTVVVDVSRIGSL